MSQLAFILKDLQETAVALADLRGRISKDPNDDILRVNAETLVKRRRDLELIRNLVHEHTRSLALYRCDSCGFKARQFYWHCPACRGWETYPPRRSEERELAA